MNKNHKIRVGSRKSELALIQTRHVINCLKNIHPAQEFEIVTMSTLGDKVLDIPLPKIGQKSLFTQELEAALATGTVDFVVHSLKDLPTTLPSGMTIGAVLSREDPRDALVLRSDHQQYTLETLPKNSVIGTSSLRRTAQLAKKYPHLKIESIRGNLNTRLRKLDELEKFHGIVLAAAGLHRMGWNHRISKVIDDDDLLYAVGQGALAVECRESDHDTILLLRPLFDPKTAIQIIAERSFLRTLGGGCSAPVAVVTKLIPCETQKFKMSLIGAVWSLDGSEEILDSEEATVEIKNNGRCALCPFGFKNYDADIPSSCSNNNCTNKDIECLNKCSFKRSIENTDNHSNKKQKSDSQITGNVSSVEVLKNDPHEHCPVELPIGVDFMGKCPYLDSDANLVNVHPKQCPVYRRVEGMDGDFSKCPFLKERILQTIIPQNNDEKETDSPSTSQTTNKKIKTYVGLVSHEDIPEWALDEAQNVGVQLAEKLIKKGAIQIMSKAQEVIRSS